MPYFMLIEETEMETLVGAVNFSIRHYQSELGQILRERVAKLNQGETAVLEWKADKHDELLHTIDRLDLFGDKLRALPMGRDCDLV